MLKRQHDTLVLVVPIARTLPDIQEADWIGIDSGYQQILNAGLMPLAAIGDFDTGSADENLPFDVERFPVRKDETDSELAMQMASRMGYSKIILWGALSGRLDHTLANLRCMAWKYPDVICMDENHRVSVLLSGVHKIHRGYRHISFFACDPCRLTLQGFSYPLNRQPLDQREFYTCSNSLAQGNECGTVIVERGRVICVETNCP